MTVLSYTVLKPFSFVLPTEIRYYMYFKYVFNNWYVTPLIWNMETHHLFITFYCSVWLFQEARTHDRITN